MYPKKIILIGVWAIFGLCASPVQTQEAEMEVEQLSEFLDQHGLKRLAICHDEQRLANTVDPAQRGQIAKDLATRYRSYFFSNLPDASVEKFVEQAQWLSTNYPVVNTSGFRLAIFHARFILLERQIQSWWRDSAAIDKRQPIFEQLKKLENKLASLLRSDENLQNALIADIALDQSEQRIQQQQLHEVELRLMHGHYLFAWTIYYLSMLSSEISKPKLLQAKSSFYRSLRIERTEPIEKIDSKWLDFSAPISGRALLGLAGVLVALDQVQSAKFCLDQAEAILTAKFNRAKFELEALVFAGKWQRAVEYVELQRDSLAQDERVEFWEAVANAGYSRDDDINHARNLRRLGLLGLATEFALDPLERIANTEQIDFPQGSLELRWIQTLVKYQTCDSSKTILKTCLQEANELLQDFDNQQTQPFRPTMIYLTSLIHYKLGDFHQAERLLQTIAVADRKGREFVRNVDWLDVLIQLQISNRNPDRTAHALSIVDRFVDTHPDSKFYYRAMFERIRLAGSMKAAHQALLDLKKISRDSSYYTLAQLEVVNCLRRCWLEARNDDARRKQYFDQLLAADKSYRGLPEVDDNSRLQSIIAVTDISLRAQKDPALIQSLIEAGEDLIATQPELIQEHQVLNFFKFRLCKQTGEIQKAIDHAQSHCIDSTERTHRIAALAFLSDMAEQHSDKYEFQIGIVQIYELLVADLGASSETFTRSKNARVAATRLAKLYVDHDTNLGKASELINKLLSATPSQLELLLYLGRVQLKNGQTEAALGTWRKVSRSVPIGTDIWFEAKLGTIHCLKLHNPSDAAKLLKQTKLLTEQIPVRWANSFEKLKLELQPD